MGFRDAREQRPSRWSRTRKLIGGVVSTALVASSMIVVGGTLTAAPAAAAEPFLCTPGAVYVQSTSEVREFAVNEQGGAPGDGGTLSSINLGANHSNNALGLSSNGRYAYTVTNAAGSKMLAKHDRVTDTTTRTSFSLNSSVLRGAVHPVTGVYYFASGTINGAINLYAWNENVTPQTYVQVGTLRPTTGSSAFGANGDMAFSASGQLVLVADNYIYSSDLPSTLQPSTATIDAKQVHDMGAGVQGNGIAFGNLGHIFVSVSGGGNRIIEVDLPRGATVNTTSLGNFGPTDMASCTFPNTLTLKKDLPNGRQADTDQFALRVQSPTGYQVPQTDATTRGAQPGLQPDYAGPVFTNQGDTFQLSESPAGTTDPTRYDASLVCVQVNPDGSTTPVAVTADGQVTQPSGPLGTDVTCTYTNLRLAPGLALRKTSDPANGTAVTAGQRVTYTVEAENTGNTRLDPVTVSDDLSGVRAVATYQGDVATAIDGDPVTSGAATVTGDELAWSGALEPGQVLTVTYSVIVDEGAEGERIANSVTASGTPPGGFDPIVPPAVTTEHPVAGFELVKTSSPASGSTVEPGQTIQYTVTGTNTGATPLDPASLTDDLSGVLAHAAYNDDLATAIDGTTLTTGGATLTGSTLAWTGALQPGQTVTVTYSVTVGEDASGEILRNTVAGSGTPVTPDPGDPTGPLVPGEPIVPPTSTTEHPVLGSGFTISKTADPASGTRVDPGSVITYTVTGTNTGDTVLDPATITDDLRDVLAHASSNDDATATRGDVRVADGTLNWSGRLLPGQDVVITYSVTVDATAGGELIANTATGAATPLIPTDPSDPDSPTTPGTPITPPPATTEHPVNEPGFTFAKTVDPATGTAVDPGTVLTYTLTAANTGETVLDPVAITDDLSGVLPSAAYNGDAVATIGGASAGAVTVDGATLAWSGSLAVGETVTVTYSVTVTAEGVGTVIENAATASATPPGGSVITPPPGTTTTPVNRPGFSLSKSADPATGTALDPGAVITYTVTGVNTGETALDPVAITDDLSDVLAHAAFNGDATATIDGVPATAPTVAGDRLSWSGALPVGATVTLTYSVTVAADAGGTVLANRASGSATPPGGVPPIETPPATTEHPVNAPGFELRKTADPADGTRVDPGSVITYTVTGVNTGETALAPVSIDDDLSGVLAHADYNGDATATVVDGVAPAPVVAGDELTWTGDLAVGQRVTITYSVTVHADAGGATIANTVEGTATPPGGAVITPPPTTTENPVGPPGFTFAKTSDPGSGTAVATGSVVTYTLTGTNTGETGLDEVVVRDDLAGVLRHADLRGTATATVGDREVAAPVIDGTALRWTGSLAEGESVVITYAVTVHADAAGASLRNVAVASATPPGGETITPPAGTTENRVLTPLAVTGGQLAPWVLMLAIALLLAGAALLIVRRRRMQA
ncbi:isopeptide-forming domain-containing fimbrial protein [Aneurinibacillus sp. BA2021]|nr:isopeptide-forming domain-containing fimbrial protein [Aneurinibacillus sp. BA2021]